MKLRRRAAELAIAFREHRLATFASAISFRALVALVPLTLLALGLLGALHQRSAWSKSLAPRIRGRVIKPVYEGINAAVLKILDHGTAGLIVLATALVLWHMTAAVATVMEALNRIHDVDDDRPWWLSLLTALWLAVATVLCVIGSALVVSVAPKAAGGFLHVLLGIGRWLAAAVLLGLAVGLLVRYAPAEHPRPRWASGGSIAIIASWIVLSLVFKLWVAYVSNFKTAVGFLTAFLVLGAYVYLSVVVFLAGVQLDELLRVKSGAGKR